MEYAWNRRWIPSEVGGSDGGSDSARSRSFKALWQMRHSVEGLLLQSIEATPCLILLGEPGMGKTYAVLREVGRLDSLRRNNEMAHFVDLLGSDSPQQVRERLFNNQIYRDWKAGQYQLTYFIDSVDKTATPVDHVLAELHNELRTADLFRLRLRLVCRDYDWSMRFSDGLRSLWKETPEGVSQVHVLQLAPLSYEDICLAAQYNAMDPEMFLKDLEAADALALATIPITLEMLLQTGEFTSNRLELYEKGIRRLCRRAEERDVSEKRLSERVMTASTLAAVMLLGDKYWVDIESESIGESVLSVRDLFQDSDMETKEKLVRETLITGLFQGDRQRSWIHQSFAEYLAAVYLSAPEIPIKEIMKFTTNSSGAFATQLYEVLRWLIEMRTDVLNEIVARQPELFLTTDLSHLDDKDFRSIYKAMLSLDDPYIYSKRTWDLKKFRATHPSASKVLLPYLQDNEGEVYRRRFVLDLLECHAYPDMEDVLVDLALNEYEDGVLRKLAARGIREVGSVDARLELKPYILGRQDDPEDELKGYALQALWPGQLTADELFKALLPPKRENYFGSYRQFLLEDSILSGLQADDWSVALNWVAAQSPSHEMPLSLQDFPGKIMRQAWDNRHIPGVLEAFARTVVSTILRFDGLFGRSPNTYPPDQEFDVFEQAFVDDAQARRDLILLTLPHLLAKDVEAWRLRITWPPMVIPDDLDWLLGLLESDETRRGQLAGLVARLAGYDIEKVYEASERHHELKQLTQHYFVSMLNDPTVVSERKYFRETKSIEENQRKQLAESRPIERIHDALNQVEAGEPLQWLNVLFGLAINSDIGSSWKIEPDLMEFPNWNSCDDATRVRIIQAAEAYILSFEYRPCDHYDENWYFSNRISHAELAGYRAMFLLLKSGVEALDELPFDRWNKWSKVIVWFPHVPISLNDGRTEYHKQTVDLQGDLLRRLYQNAPQPLLDNLRQLHLANDSRDSYLGQTLAKVEHLWDPALEATLLNLLRESCLSAKGQRSLLDFLLENENAAAVYYAEELISSGYSNDEQQCLLIEFCTSLMASASKYDWSVVWNAIQRCDDLGKTIAENVAKEERIESHFGGHLSARELADLFLWIEERYPSCQDPQIDGFHAVSTREQVGQWRNSLITQIGAKNSQDAHSEIRRIIERAPQLEWLNLIRIDLEKAVQDSDWSPPSPGETLELLPPVLEIKYGRLRQWIRDNPTETATIVGLSAVAVTVILYLLSANGSEGQGHLNSVDPASVLPSDVVINHSEYAEDRKLSEPGQQPFAQYYYESSISVVDVSATP